MFNPWQAHAQFTQTVSTIMQQRAQFLQQQAAQWATIPQQISQAKTPIDAMHTLWHQQGQSWAQLCSLAATIHSQRTYLAQLWHLTPGSSTIASAKADTMPKYQTTSPTPQAQAQPTPQPTPKATPQPTPQPTQAAPKPQVWQGRMPTPNTTMVVDVPVYLKGTFIPAATTVAPAPTAQITPTEPQPTATVTTLPTSSSVARHSGQASTFAAAAGTRRSVVASRTARASRARSH